MKNLEGQKIPEAVFRTRRGADWVNRTSAEIFDGRTVVVFSLPGAFTPTCSSSHVPRFNQLAKAFARHGVDEIVCISVNDAFVMNEWQESQKAWNVTFLPDGNGEFTENMGMLVDKGDLGFGARSWRYSMLARDGVIEKMFIESEVPGDPYDVSDADTMLSFIAPDEACPPSVTVFTRKGCPHCVRARQLLEDHGYEYEELVLNRDYTDRTLRAVAGAATFPQVFIDGKLIGGADDLEVALREDRVA